MTTEHNAGASPADRPVSTVLAGGQDGAGSPPWRGSSSGRDARPDIATAAPAGRLGSAAAEDSGDVPAAAPDAAVDPWPAWARPQLQAAVALAAQVGPQHAHRALATKLYREWYSPAVGHPVDPARSARPLAGTYRIAHAGSGARILADGIALIDRHDTVGRDGWWRTWNDDWTPTDGRRHSVRVLLSPSPERLADFVTAVTAALLEADTPWLLACATDPRRLSRSGAAVLYVPGLDALRAGLLTLLRPMLQPIAPPLCLPLAPGAALAEFPGDGASFGARRCHLIAQALQRPAGQATPPADQATPLEIIADVFAANGIDPHTPYRAARG